MLAGDGDDYRKLPLSLRKLQLSRLLRSRNEGIFIAPFEQGEIGPDLFRHACKFGLEGLVSKRRDRPKRAAVAPLSLDADDTVTHHQQCSAGTERKRRSCHCGDGDGRGDFASRSR
jgi:hypothetical protein